MRVSVGRSSIIATLGSLALAWALLAVVQAGLNQTGTRASEYTAISSPVANVPTGDERAALEPASLGYLEFDWNADNRVPGFKVN